jgi:hypothetical protein
MVVTLPALILVAVAAAALSQRTVDRTNLAEVMRVAN